MSDTKEFVIVTWPNPYGFRTVKVYPDNELETEYTQKYVTDETIEEIITNHPDAEFMLPEG